jgi:hypothetical protein
MKSLSTLQAITPTRSAGRELEENRLTIQIIGMPEQREDSVVIALKPNPMGKGGL